MRTASQQGFTLLGLMFLLALFAVFFGLSLGYSIQKTQRLQLDRAAINMQEILNSALIYYLNTGGWPPAGNLNGTHLLQTQGYVVSPLSSPWAGTFTAGTSAQGYFTVSVNLPTTVGNIALTAQALANRLPMGLTCVATVTTTPCATPATCTTSGCEVTAQINTPGADLSNARSVNFAGLYHNGACVPAPTCPQGMQASIYTVPVAINGVNDSPSCTGTGSSENMSDCTFNIYPISNFNAYATGPNTLAPSGTNPPGCTKDVSSSGTPTTLSYPPCFSTTPTTSAEEIVNYQTWTDPNPLNQSQSFWRVCLQVTTQKGSVTVNETDPNGIAWGQAVGSVLAVTRCVPASEPSGSDFTVFQ